MTGLLAFLLLLAPDPTSSPPPDAGVPQRPVRSAEDEEVIRNLDLLEHLADGEALEMVLELEAERAKP